MSVDRQTLEEALTAAKDATGNTLLVLVSPTQAKRLWLALQIADKIITNDLDGCTGLAIAYMQLVKA